MNISAPIHIPGLEQHVFSPQFEDDIGVCADKSAARRNLSQHGIQYGTIRPVLNGVHPNQNAIHTRQLLAHVVCKFIAVHGGFRRDAVFFELRKRSAEPIIVRRCLTARFSIPMPKNCHARIHDDGPFIFHNVTNLSQIDISTEMRRFSCGASIRP